MVTVERIHCGNLLLRCGQVQSAWPSEAATEREEGREHIVVGAAQLVNFVTLSVLWYLGVLRERDLWGSRPDLTWSDLQLHRNRKW